MGRFELLRKIGVGGMGSVWKAAVQGPAGFRKIVAVKRIRTDVDLAAKELVEMFINEAKLVAQLQHPSIVQVFDFGQFGNAEEYFIAMEYVAGKNLAQILDTLGERGGRLSRDICIFIVTEVARGLAYAHGGSGRHVVVHRDISPHNVLISFDGSVKITDFGVAKTVDAGTTGVGELRGKFKYMSPEQMRAEAIDQRTDIFALGSVMFELLTSQPLFAGETHEIVDQLSKYDPAGDPRILTLEPAMREIFSRALAPQRENRYPNALELEAALTGLLDTQRIMIARRALISLMRLVFEEDYQQEVAEQDDNSNGETPVGAEATVAPEPESLKGSSLIGEEGTSLPNPFEPGPADPRIGSTGEFHLETGAACKSCSKTVESFLGDSDLCFECLDGAEQSSETNTAYVQVSADRQPVKGQALDGGANEERVAIDPNAPYGWLFMSCDQPADVWINGVRTQMPIQRYVLQPGQHKLVVMVAAANMRLEESVVMHAGVEVNLFIDVKNQDIRRW